jgi:hypothetical protein
MPTKSDTLPGRENQRTCFPIIGVEFEPPATQGRCGARARSARKIGREHAKLSFNEGKTSNNC